MPPELYRVTYHVKGLYVSASGEILERDLHEMEVNLSLGYPRRAPQCRMLTPLFHPNFDETTVCIGDFWAASEGLDDLVMRVARMIAYQEYNIKSPLNGFAAKWAAEHASLLPVDDRVLTPPTLGTSSNPIQSPTVSTPLSDVPFAASQETSIGTTDPWAQKITIRNNS
jgi:hypothetical protein